MGGVDLVVPIGADQHADAADPTGSGDPRAGRASPRRAIADRRERAPADVPARANTPIKRRNTSWNRPCACCGSSSGTGGWSPMMSFSSGMRSVIEPTVRPQRLEKRVAPDRQLGVALAEKRPDQALKSLRQRRIGDVALVLVELAGCEQPARRHKRLVQLVDDRGFADAGIAGDQHQFRRAAR